MPVRGLPNRKTTTKDKVYIREWEKYMTPIATEFKLDKYGFDPDCAFRKKEGDERHHDLVQGGMAQGYSQAVSLPLWFAALLCELIKEVRGHRRHAREAKNVTED